MTRAAAGDGEQAMNALSPCPFCGASDLDRIDSLNTDSGNRAEIGKWGWVECGCGARGPDVRALWGHNEGWQEDAIAAWNRRAVPPREAVAKAMLFQFWAVSKHLLSPVEITNEMWLQYALEAADAILALLGGAS